MTCIFEAKDRPVDSLQRSASCLRISDTIVRLPSESQAYNRLVFRSMVVGGEVIISDDSKSDTDITDFEIEIVISLYDDE